MSAYQQFRQETAGEKSYVVRALINSKMGDAAFAREMLGALREPDEAKWLIGLYLNGWTRDHPEWLASDLVEDEGFVAFISELTKAVVDFASIVETDAATARRLLAEKEVAILRNLPTETRNKLGGMLRLLFSRLCQLAKTAYPEPEQAAEPEDEATPPPPLPPRKPSSDRSRSRREPWYIRLM